MSVNRQTVSGNLKILENEVFMLWDNRMNKAQETNRDLKMLEKARAKKRSKKLRVDEKIVDIGTFPLKAVALFPPMLKSVYAQLIFSIEREEKPLMKAYIGWNEKREVAEVHFVLSVDRMRLEELKYFTKEPPTWEADATQISSCDTFEKFCRAGLEAEKAKEIVAQKLDKEELRGLQSATPTFYALEALKLNKRIESRVKVYFQWV